MARIMTYHLSLRRYTYIIVVIISDLVTIKAIVFTREQCVTRNSRFKVY